MNFQNKTRLIFIEVRLRQELRDLIEIQKQYPNFFQFNRNTGLGKAYRLIEKKLKIIDRLTNP